MKQEQLEKLLLKLKSLSKECEWVEFKLNEIDPQEIGEYISALSNSACYHDEKLGYLVFGIEDVTHNLLGSTFYPSKTKKGNQEIENWLATQLNPRIDFNINEFDYNGNHFVIFIIDATRTNPVSFRGISYIRIGSYKKKLDDHPERESKIWNKAKIFVFEKEPAIENIPPDEVLKLIDYPGFFDLLKLPLPDNRKGILQRLEDERIIKPSGSFYSISNLGGLLFAKKIDLFETLARKAVRVIIYSGNNRLTTKKEQPGGRGYALGFEGLIKYIMDQFTSEVISGAFRKEVSPYPEIAIRELVANAIIHQDFSVKGSSPMVEIFNDRIEITNPGRPLIEILRFIDHNPESRNELLARFMRRFNICEERGSGIDKVVFACEYNQLPAPNFQVGDNFTRVILYAPKSLRSMDKNDKIRACYLHSCLKYVSNEMMTNQTLRVRFGIDEKNSALASRIIKDTITVGLIKEEDPNSTSKKFARYIPFWA